MQKHLGFLKIASIIVKVVAWLSLFLGALGGISIISGLVPNNPRWFGLIILSVYIFSFFFLYLVAKLADLVAQIISEIELKK